MVEQVLWLVVGWETRRHVWCGRRREAGTRVGRAWGGQGACVGWVGALGWVGASNDGTWGGWEAWSDGRSYRLRVGGHHATPF